MLIEQLLEISAKYIKIAIIIEIIPIDRFDRSVVSKIEGIKNLINPPRKTIGIVPIKIDFKNFLPKKAFKKSFEDFFLNKKISPLK